MLVMSLEMCSMMRLFSEEAFQEGLACLLEKQDPELRQGCHEVLQQVCLKFHRLRVNTSRPQYERPQLLVCTNGRLRRHNCTSH